MEAKMEKIKFYPGATRCRHCQATTAEICECCGGCKSACCRCRDDSDIVFVGRQIHWNTKGGTRRFRCFNVNHYVDSECAETIIQEKLGYNHDDYDEELIDAVTLAQQEHLKRIMPEVFFEIIGAIDDDDIEDMLCDEISEATGWLHEGFEFEEIDIKETKKERAN